MRASYVYVYIEWYIHTDNIVYIYISHQVKNEKNLYSLISSLCVIFNVRPVSARIFSLFNRSKKKREKESQKNSLKIYIFSPLKYELWIIYYFVVRSFEYRQVIHSFNKTFSNRLFFLWLFVCDKNEAKNKISVRNPIRNDVHCRLSLHFFFSSFICAFDSSPLTLTPFVDVETDITFLLFFSIPLASLC